MVKNKSKTYICVRVKSLFIKSMSFVILLIEMFWNKLTKIKIKSIQNLHAFNRFKIKSIGTLKLKSAL